MNDFLDKYKDNANAIIGHFGLGFYSSFMVSKKVVEIVTKSYKDGAKAVKWSCDGSPVEISDAEKADRGSDIIPPHRRRLQGVPRQGEDWRTAQQVLQVHGSACGFRQKTEWKDGKQVETEEDNIINSVEPLWTKTPSTLKDEDYKNLPHAVPHAGRTALLDSPNVDYPFNLTGILYFPRIKSNIELQRNKIQLYCNQVFVTDQVEA